MPLLAAGCASEYPLANTLPFATVDVQANSLPLKSAAERMLGRLTLDGDNPTTLQLTEQHSVEITARTRAGTAARRRHKYSIDFTLADQDSTIHSGQYRFTQVVDNDETTHLANQLADKRFVETARGDGIASILEELQLLQIK